MTVLFTPANVRRRYQSLPRPLRKVSEIAHPLDDEDESESGRKSTKKEFASLFELNEQCHNEELLAGAPISMLPKEDARNLRNIKITAGKSSRGQQNLFDESTED